MKKPEYMFIYNEAFVNQRRSCFTPGYVCNVIMTPTGDINIDGQVVDYYSWAVENSLDNISQYKNTAIFEFLDSAPPSEFSMDCITVRLKFHSLSLPSSC